MAKRKPQAVPPQLQSFPQAVTPETIQRASVRPLSTGVGPVPVAPVAQNVQLTPIVQPLAFVPYSTQEQPLFMFDDDNTVADIPDFVADEAPIAVQSQASEQTQEAAKPRKGVKGVPIILMLLSLVIVAVFLVGKYIAAVSDYTYLYALEGVKHNGLDITIDVVKAIAAGNIIALEYAAPAAVALAGVFAVFTFVASLIRICKKGACVFAKITTAFGLLFALLALILSLVQDATMGYGLYIVGGISLLSFLIAYLSPNR